MISMRFTMLIFLLIMSVFCLNCIKNTGEVQYSFPAGNKFKIVVIDSSFQYFLKVIDSTGKVKKIKQIGIGVSECGISSASWERKKNLFAIKLCGEENYVQIYLFNIPGNSDTVFINPTQKDIPAWVKFTVVPGFDLQSDSNIDSFKIK
jgi:hypothetical protein